MFRLAVVFLVALYARAEEEANLRRELYASLPALGIAGEGFLGIYQAGALSMLHDLGVVTRSTKMAGISSGSITVGAYCAGAPAETMKASVFATLQECNYYAAYGIPFCGSSIEPLNKRALKAGLPAGDTEVVKNCKDSLEILVVPTTQASVSDPTMACYSNTNVYLASTGTEIISQIETRDDLIETMLTSSYLPYASSKLCSRNFQGATYVDGGYRVPVFCPEGHPNCPIISGKPSGCWPTCGQANTFTAAIYPGIRTDGSGNEIFPGTLIRADWMGALSFNFSTIQANREALYMAGRLDAAHYVGAPAALASATFSSGAKETIGAAWLACLMVLAMMF